MEQGTLGKRIAYHRKRLGMTQEQLAQRVGVSAQAVSKWENNLSCPDITILPELASIFGISVDELLGRTPPKEERVHEAEVIKPEEKEHILDYTIGSAARSGLWFAIYVLAIGALFLVNALGKFDVSVWTILWTSALLLGGLSMLTHRFSCFSIGLMLVGGYSLLTAFGFLSIGFRWSVLIPAQRQDRGELWRLHRRPVRLRGRAGQLPADRRDEFRQPDAARAGPLRRHGLREGHDGSQPRSARDAL